MMAKPNRKPMDKLNGFDSREAIWAEIRRLKSFTVRELYEGTTLKLDSVREYVAGLKYAGYVAAQVSDAPFVPFKTQATVYTLVRDVGIDAPRVRKDGTPVTQGQGTANMWRTMRILGTFSARELAVSASTETCVIKENTAARYLRYLCDAGYLHNQKGLYRFLPSMHTGPKPPMIQNVKRVWDQNLKKVMWSEVEPPPTPSLTKGGGL